MASAALALTRSAPQMWKASAGHAVSISQDDGGADDWETDPDFEVSPHFLVLSGTPEAVVWVLPALCVSAQALDSRVPYFFFQNDVSEKEQRWGAKTVQGSGHQEHIK